MKRLNAQFLYSFLGRSSLEIQSSMQHGDVCVRSVSGPQISSPPRRKRMGQWGRSLLRILVGSRDPQITQKCDHHGQLTFQVYDPVTHTRHQFNDAAEVRAWLDQRY